ncbi:MAG: hypothetical protein HY646_21635 [Acidobacteria bacterium]|nr:hypothetical protein [Acidobacteriota bacterium]
MPRFSTPCRSVATFSIPIDDGGVPGGIVVDGRDAARDQQEIAVQFIPAMPSFFSTVGKGLLEGRSFTDAEAGNPDAPVAIVNQALVWRLWPDGGAVGRRAGVVNGRNTTWLNVVVKSRRPCQVCSPAGRWW